jgi:hypothetical protein
MFLPDSSEPDLSYIYPLLLCGKVRMRREQLNEKNNDQQIKPFSSIYIDKIKGWRCCSSFIYHLVLICKLWTIYVQIISEYHLVYWINNSAIMLEIIGFVLLLNALRRPIPPHNTDIRSNIVYLESLMSNTRSWVSRIGVGLIIAGVIMQVMFSQYMN